MPFLLFSVLLIFNINISYGYNNTCLSDPTQQNCINFKLPEDVLKEDIGNLCGEMNFMCGCSVQNICKDSKYSSGVYCGTFSIYKDLCLDMGGMSGMIESVIIN